MPGRDSSLTFAASTRAVTSSPSAAWTARSRSRRRSQAKAAGTALWHRDGDGIAAGQAPSPAFFDAVTQLPRLPLIPGPGASVIREGETVPGAAGASGDDDRACVEAGLRAAFDGWTP